MARKFDITNKETGEVYEGEERELPKRAGVARLDGFVQTWGGELIALGVGGKELKVLVWLAQSMGVESGMVQYTLGEIADNVGMTPNHVSNVLALLKRKGAIRGVRRGVAFVNPNVFWRGPGGYRRAAQMRWQNPDMSYRPDWLERQDAS